MKNLWQEIDDFSMSDFDSPDEAGSGAKMKASTMIKLQTARDFSRRVAQKRNPESDCPYVINSGFRTKEHNKKVGGKENSSHRKGYAVDIKATTSRHRHDIIFGLMMAGFNRIGIGKTFIHADDDPDKDEDVIWLYG